MATPATVLHSDPSRSNDQAVSEVVSVILMVAVVVILVAGAYVWFNSLTASGNGSEALGLRLIEVDADDNGQPDWARISMIKGAETEYYPVAFKLNITDGDNAFPDQETHVCTAVNNDAPSCASDDEEFFDDGFSGAWSQGSSLYVPCTAKGSMWIQVTFQDTVVLEKRIKCGEIAG